jgi:septum site-determining protein MinD
MSDSVYAVAGGKGGVGTTTTAINLAGTFRATGRSVALLDADLPMPDVRHELGLEAEATVHVVLGGGAELDEALVAHEIGVAGRTDTVDVIPGSGDLMDFAEADADLLRDVIAVLDESYDVVVVDTATGLSQEVAVPMRAADNLVVVTTPDTAAVSDTATVVDFADNIGADVAGVVVTDTDEGSASSAADDLGLDLLATVPGLTGGDPTDAYQNVVASLLLGDALPKGSLDFDADATEERPEREAAEPRTNISLSEAMESPRSETADDGEERADAEESEGGEAGEDVEIGGAFGRFVRTFGGSGED